MVTLRARALSIPRLVGVLRCLICHQLDSWKRTSITRGKLKTSDNMPRTIKLAVLTAWKYQRGLSGIYRYMWSIFWLPTLAYDPQRAGNTERVSVA